MTDAPLARKSKLIPIGVICIIAGITLPAAIEGMIGPIAPDHRLTDMQRVLYVMTDVMRLFFFAGVMLLLIGWTRNRRWKKEDAAIGV